jgi:molybdopterin molybdotransferase
MGEGAPALTGGMNTSPLTPRDAAIHILEQVRRQPPLRVPLDDALDAVLAENIISPIDIPAWDNSAMDGYAVRSVDTREASPNSPVSLRVVEQIPAGHFPSNSIERGTCARIFTGAPVPRGADAVVRQEDTDQGGDRVAIGTPAEPGQNVRRAGEDIGRGSTVLSAETEIGPAHVGVLASLAVSNPMIYRRPRVAILGGGDEIVDIDQPDEILSGRKIASSNSHTLAALVRRAGGEPVGLGIARDTPESLREHLVRALDCDLIITTGGISVGEHDFIRPVLVELGGEVRFWKLRMRPGAPVGFGRLGDIPWLGLPGNPVSTMVTFELFARPAIRKLSGRAKPFRRSTPVTVGEPIRVTARLQHFLRVVLTNGKDGGLEAKLTGPQGSGILTSMMRADALLIVPEGQFETPSGARAQALVLDHPAHQELPAF